MASIAIVGMACRYPDAPTPAALWENVLAQRRAFRRIPPERLCREDYFSPDRDAPDCTYATQAAVIDGYEFDRVKYRVVGSTYRSADLAHWLALDIAAQALADAGFPEGDGLPRGTTGVVLGNTLTGEFSRANVLRLRWPYVRRVVEAALVDQGWPPERRHEFLDQLEGPYKAPFPPIGEESLAGGLSNTIAGRICNHFDLKGGGYTVDGACAASLLAVATACSALVAGDLDVALAGGVDLSLDPFEIVGFAKAGALAPEEMRVFDAHSAGFWPGEGCGVVVLMRHDEALAQGRPVYAVIRGWGISSDGKGGITRPEMEGQLLAVRRAYQRAGFGIDTVAYFEGHGTGTSVGDATELRTLVGARRAAAGYASPAAIGTIKANIGHTKAAAGIAGLLKATLALHHQIVPPTTGCEEPHPELTAEAANLRIVREGERWPVDQPLRAGVSAMGFGGINSHLVLEGPAGERRQDLGPSESSLLCSMQDAELLLLGADDHEGLLQRVEHLSRFADRLSRAEVADLAAQLERTLAPQAVRAALVASSPADVAGRLETLRTWLQAGVRTQLDFRAGLFLGTGGKSARIGFLFPGQGSPAHVSGGLLRRRFEMVKALYARTDLADEDSTATEVAQPAIVTASLAGLRILEQLGIRATVAVGHSLGEITALHWAGALDEEAVLRIARARGRAMADLGRHDGAMASIAAGADQVDALIQGEPVVKAGLNGPRQTVISGEARAVATVAARALRQGLRAVLLPVSHAFHSPLVEAAAPALAEQLHREVFRPLEQRVVSTVTGTTLGPEDDLRALLVRQVALPVRFQEAASAAMGPCDLLIEVGPGQVLHGLATQFLDVPVVAIDAGGPSLGGLLRAAGAAFVLGAKVNHRVLFAGRFTRPFDLNWRPRFFGNPCELAPLPESGELATTRKKWEDGNGQAVTSARPATEVSPLALVRQLVAERAELPAAAVKDDMRLLGALHLNSISVGQIVADASRRMGLSPPVSPTDYADATVLQIARALEERARTGNPSEAVGAGPPAGVDSWIRTFTVELVERPLPRRQPSAHPRGWRIISLPDDPLKIPLEQAAGCGATLQAAAVGRIGNPSYDKTSPDPESGVIVCLPPAPDELHAHLLLQGAQAVFAQGGTGSFVVVQRGGGGAGFARTLHLEFPETTTCVVDVPVEQPRAAEWVLAEASTATGYAEAHYDASGTRREPVLRLMPPRNAQPGPPLGPDDVLLVTGGGKGIAAEGALSLAQATGVRLALLGRSQPAADRELAANLERLAAAGITFCYLSADVTDREAIRAAVTEVQERLGPVTAILHGAGTNVPRLLNALTESAFHQTVAPKLQGARNLLAAIDPARLRLFLTFGSIIARTGLRGEADYAAANEWLTQLTERWQAANPHCRCLAIEWSVWSGVGMGERLGRIDALVQQGITPISPDEGIRILGQLLRQDLPATAVVVTGRFGDPPTLQVERPELPLLRFLERPRVYYPGVELVVEASLSPDTDPYLNDHVFRKSRLFPAVLGLEAMAQAAMALVRTDTPPVFEDVQFARPVAVAEGQSVTIRVAALMQGPGRVEVVLRSEETAFGVNHFRALCRFDEPADVSPRSAAGSVSPAATPVPLQPERDLYGSLLFHTGRFRRLGHYRRLRARQCLAEIVPDGNVTWFGSYLPAELVLGDPAARDAAIHAIQACIPHATVLPVGVERVQAGLARAEGLTFVHARERLRDGKHFLYDLEITTAGGQLVEHWQGLKLTMAESLPPRETWPVALLGPYLERRLHELLPGSAVELLVEQSTTTDRRPRSNAALEQLLGSETCVHRRPDGKPHVPGERDVSVAHAGSVTLAVTGPGPVACDVAEVARRPDAIWRDLLGADRFTLAQVVAEQAAEDLAVAATRLWAAGECLKKAGAAVQVPLVFASAGGDGWIMLEAGSLMIATVVVAIPGVAHRLIVAVLTRCDHARL